jgi:putative two-component system response regulator
VALAEGLGCSTEFVKRIRLYAPLHDVGKVGIPDNILKKKGRFTKDEADIMRQHVMIGARFLDNYHFDPMAKNIALYHHEKWDGTGYYQGLKGEDIPLEARVLSAADVYDALSYDRVYRKALPEEQIDLVFMKRTGTHFDPSVVETFFNIKDRLIEIKETDPDFQD